MKFKGEFMFYSMKKNKEDFKITNGPSHLRVLNAAPEYPSIDVLVNNEKFENLQFSKASNFISLPNGNYDVKVFTADTENKLILDTKIDISPNSKLTLSINGIFPDIKLLHINELATFNNTTGSKVRFVHLSPTSPTLDVFINENEVFGNVRYEDSTEYLNISSGEYSLEVRSIKDNSIILNLEHIVFEEGLCKTIYALGTLDDEPLLNIIQDNLQNRSFNIEENKDENNDVEENVDIIITNSDVCSEKIANLTSTFFRSNYYLINELYKYGMDSSLSEYLIRNITRYVKENLPRYSGDSKFKANHAVYDLKITMPWLFEIFSSFDIRQNQIEKLVGDIAYFTFENL